ncbi:homoserine kinase [Ferrovibrio sp.]|uniref:homoserine kinase n=1 Tax=Ferrovibrio sp. TaxID=1917215 RepID=UPI0031205461
MAVYTEIDDDQLAALLSRYDLGPVLSCKGIAEGVENSNYLLVTGTGSFILTLYERRVNRHDLPYFIGLMEHLAGKGLPCPTPIADRDGSMLNEVAGRPCAIISFINGVWPKRPTARHCQELGSAMARMHLAGRDFMRQRPNALSVEGWRGLLGSCLADADSVRPGLAAELQQEYDHLKSNWPAAPGRAGDTPLPHGVIHADLFPDNVFFIGEALSGLIDFYFACNDYFAYDLAIVLNAWCFEVDGAFNVTKGRALVAGYESIRPLTGAEVSALPLFARGAALRFLLTRLYDWVNQVPGALVRPKDPLEYRQKLKFHRQVQGAAAYGIER